MRKLAVAVLLAFGAGVFAGLAGSAAKSGPGLFAGKSPKDAAVGLLAVASPQAGKGSWENIAVARAYILMGEKDQGQAILDRVVAGKMKGNDWVRVGRLWQEAAKWELAKDAFGKALALDPKDAELAAEVGAYYNLHGDRARAEELFTKSFSFKDDEVWNTVNAAGSYVGVKPQ